MGGIKLLTVVTYTLHWMWAIYHYSPGISLTLGISFHLEHFRTSRTSANVTQNLEKPYALLEWPGRYWIAFQMTLPVFE